MPIKVEGIIDAELMFVNIDTTAKKRVRSKLVERGRAIRDLARRMAPVDTGDLEKSIVLVGEDGGKRDEGGRFARTEVEVMIDMDMPVADRPGKTMGDYAYEMHEHLTPYGPLQLGPLSVQKQQGESVQVGGGFLERAAEDLDSSIDMALLDIFRDL